MRIGATSAFVASLAFALALVSGSSWSSPDQAGAVVIYVSALHGSDLWSGRLSAPNSDATDGPLASFEGARAMVRSIDKTKLRKIVVLFRDGSQSLMADEVSPFDRQRAKIDRAVFHPDAGADLSLLKPADASEEPRVFRDGVYTLPATVMLGAADSGSPQTEIVYENYPGEHPVFSGGVRVLNWVNVGANKWQATLPQTMNLFENLFYNGERRLRPRLGGYLGPYNRIAQTTTVSPSDMTWVANNCMAYKPPTPPECFDRFTYNTQATAPADEAPTILDPDSWGNLFPADNNPCNQGRGPKNLQGDIEVLVFEQFSSSKLRVSCVDTTSLTVYMTGPTAVPPAANAQEAGFITGNRIIFENVKNALSEPGQWFLDHPQGRPWTLTYLARFGENPNFDEVIVPQLAQLVVGMNVQHLTLRGLTFEHDNYVIPSAGHPSSELEADISSAVSFQDSSYITIDGIVIRHTAGGGLDFATCFPDVPSSVWCTAQAPTPISAHSLIENSVFYDLGVHGIRIGQNADGLETIFDDKNSPHDFIVSNNLVAGYGRVIPAAFGIGQGVGHDNLYAHNEVYDGYHTAISISHGGGEVAPMGLGNANNTFAYNRVYDLFQGIMNDGGALRIEAGNSTGTSKNNKIVNNVVHDVSDASAIDNVDLVPYIAKTGYGGNGIYLDNSTGAVEVENNLVYRVSDNAVYTPHGPANDGQQIEVKNNILAYARKAMIAVNDPQPYQTQSGPSFIPAQVFDVSHNIMYFDRDASSMPSFSIESNCTFPGDATPPMLLPFSAFESFSSNLYWSTKDAFATYADGFEVQSVSLKDLKNGDPCGSGAHVGPPTPLSFDQWESPMYGEDQGSVVKDPDFAKPYYPIDDFSLEYGSPGVGFVPFDPSQAGRLIDFFRPPPVAPGFVTMPFNPASDF